MTQRPLYPPQTTAQLTSYPIAPSGYPDDLNKPLVAWNDAILAYRLRYEPVYADPEATPRSYLDVSQLLAQLTHKRVLSRQRIEMLCRWVADQIMVEQLGKTPD